MWRTRVPPRDGPQLPSLPPSQYCGLRWGSSTHSCPKEFQSQPPSKSNSEVPNETVMLNMLWIRARREKPKQLLQYCGEKNPRGVMQSVPLSHFSRQVLQSRNVLTRDSLVHSEVVLAVKSYVQGSSTRLVSGVF